MNTHCPCCNGMLFALTTGHPTIACNDCGLLFSGAGMTMERLHEKLNVRPSLNTEEDDIKMKYFLSQGYVHVKKLSGDNWIGVLQQMYTGGLFYGLSKTGVRGRFCYPQVSDALEACIDANVEDSIHEMSPPLDDEWLKHKGIGYSYQNEELQWIGSNMSLGVSQFNNRFSRAISGECFARLQIVAQQLVARRDIFL